jgi:hypothetical protein
MTIPFILVQAQNQSYSYFFGFPLFGTVVNSLCDLLLLAT